MEITQPSTTPDSVSAISDWILAQALTDFVLEDLITGTAERLANAGYPLFRLHVTVRILHPIYSGMSFTWKKHRTIERQHHARGDDQDEKWLKSPLLYAIENRLSEYRLKIHQGEGIKEYPIITEMAEEGATDYFIYLSRFGDIETAIERKDGMVATWASDAPEGWSQSDLVDIRLLQSRLAVAMRLEMNKRLAQSVAVAYLGTDAGTRVMSGQIQRGDGEEIDAVVWFSDLRSSTRLAQQLGTKHFLTLLNQFFECTATAVAKHNGEILGYVGDSVLAIFSFEKFGGADNASQQALIACHDASDRIAELNRQRQTESKESISFGIGLHSGAVTFGNIGIPERLSFSVIGSTANEAARIADKCRDLQEEIVVSDAFRRNTQCQWRNLGEFDLRNVRYPMTLYAP